MRIRLIFLLAIAVALGVGASWRPSVRDRHQPPPVADLDDCGIYVSCLPWCERVAMDPAIVFFDLVQPAADYTNREPLPRICARSGPDRGSVQMTVGRLPMTRVWRPSAFG